VVLRIVRKQRYRGLSRLLVDLGEQKKFHNSYMIMNYNLIYLATLIVSCVLILVTLLNCRALCSQISTWDFGILLMQDLVVCKIRYQLLQQIA
jgi:hypothetical protein